ncbi:hypothetical protein HN51_008662 [Arachis hypogaea]
MILVNKVRAWLWLQKNTEHQKEQEHKKREVIGNNVSILHHVTLDSTTKIGEDRHPKISDGVLIGAGATILGNVKIGEGAKIGAGSVVLIDVPPRTTAVGNLGSLVGGKEKHSKHEDVPDELMDYTSFISE